MSITAPTKKKKTGVDSGACEDKNLVRWLYATKRPQQGIKLPGNLNPLWILEIDKIKYDVIIKKKTITSIKLFNVA